MELVAASSLTDDEAERKAIFLKLHALMAEEVPVIPLYFSPVIDAVRPNIKGYQTWAAGKRSEEHTSELQSLMRISYAVFCLKKKKIQTQTHTTTTIANT